VDARSLAALSGEAHVVKQLSTEGARAVERSRLVRLESVPTAGVTNAYVNIQRPPLDDVRLRQALSWATDREALVAVVADGQGAPAPTWLAPNPLFPEAARSGYTRLDLERGRRLLDEAGWRLPAGGRVRARDGQPLKLRLFWWGGGRTLAEVLQGQWAQLGAEIEVSGSSDYGFLQQKRAQNDWDLFIEGWGTFGEPSSLLARHVAADGDLNYMRFRDPEIDRLLAGFGDLADPEERRQQALQINARQAELVPFIPLFSRKSLTAVHRGVRNYVAHFLGTTYDLHPDLWVAA
jgi:ABC-type transport system substrate-binding protein